MAFNNIYKRKEFKETNAILPAICALDINDKLIVKDLLEFKNLLVTGAIGTRRATFIHRLIYTLSLKRKSNKLNLFLMGFVPAEIAFFSNLPQTKFTLQGFQIDGLIDTDNDHLFALKKLVDEVNYRNEMLTKLGCSNINEANKILKKEKQIPYLVCIIDYANYIKKQDVPIVTKEIEYITTHSKNTGICLVVSANKMYGSTYKEDTDYKQSYPIITKKFADYFTSKILFYQEESGNEVFKEYNIEQLEFEEMLIVNPDNKVEKFKTTYIDDRILYKS